ncbi:MAG: TetR/AcrR family transcriptional regulator [Eubacteriales bacterium]|nr:TetR/AcrR family transcriptional regulator [Eubacteriales bacterium]
MPGIIMKNIREINKVQASNLEVKDRMAHALIDLLQEKRINEIKITELIKYAKVARASFYRNFASLEDILIYGFDRIMEKFSEESSKRRSGADSRRSFIVWAFGFFNENRTAILTSYYSGIAYYQYDTITRVFLKANDATYKPFEIQLWDYFYSGAFFSVVIAWMESGPSISEEEVADRFLALCAKQEDEKNANMCKPKEEKMDY